MNRACCC